MSLISVFLQFIRHICNYGFKNKESGIAGKLLSLTAILLVIVLLPVLPFVLLFLLAVSPVYALLDKFDSEIVMNEENDVFEEPIENAVLETEAEEEALIDAVHGNAKSKIYFVKGQSFYERIMQSEFFVTFASEQEAEAAGYRKSKR